MVTVPVRAEPAFAATAIVTVPLPVPLAPAVTDNQLALLKARHVQPELADTFTVRLLALAVKFAPVALNPKPQIGWVTVKTLPPTVIFAERATPVFIVAA
jgi:hypothetical protein